MAVQKSKNKELDLIEAIRIEHPIYQESKENWLFYLSAFEGGSSFANASNLFRHSRETKEDFDDRCKRVHNFNHCQKLVEFFTSFIYNEPIQRDGGDDQDFYDEFLKDVTLRKEDITKFMPRVCNELQVFGTVYVLVDAPKINGASIITKEDQLNLNIRPYWILVSPLEILDWEKDDFDQFIYTKRRVFKTAGFGQKRKQLEVYTEYFTDRIVISTVDVTDPNNPEWGGSETIENTLGKIPIAVAYFRRGRLQDIGTSFLIDLAGNQRDVLNLTSILQEFLYKQAFNILVKEEDSNVPQNSENSELIGTSNVIGVPKDAKFPAYISPPVDPAEAIAKERDRIKMEMYLNAAQDAAAEAVSGQKSSGFSQSQSFFKTTPFITRRSDILEGLETDLMKLTMDYVGKTWGGKIKYKDRYDITAFNDSLTQLMIIAKDLAVPSQTFIVTQFKRLVKEYDPKMKTEDVIKIDKELQEIDWEMWQSNILNKSSIGSSAGEQQKDKGLNTMAQSKAEAKVDDSLAATNKLKGN